MKNNYLYIIIFLPVILVFLVMWLDSKIGIDRIEVEKDGESDKPWLKQKVTSGRNPHIEHPTSSSKSERWKILVVWSVPSLILFFFLILE